MIKVPSKALIKVLKESQELNPESAYLSVDCHTAASTLGKRQYIRLHGDDNQIHSRCETLHKETALKFSTYTIALKVYQARNHMMQECQAVFDYLHKLRLLNNNIGLHFYLNVDGAKSFSDFGPKMPRYKFGQRSISTGISHYMQKDSTPGDVTKLSPKSGVSQVVQMRGPYGSCKTLKVSTIAAVLPPVDQMHLLNSRCVKLHMLFYGLNNVPVMIQGVKDSAVNPATVVKLDDYGLTLGQKSSSEQPGTVPIDWEYDIVPISDETSADMDDVEADPLTLLVLICIERNNNLQAASVHEQLNLQDDIRQNFSSLLLGCRAKFRRSVGSAVSKLLHNYTAIEQKQQLLDMAVPSITDSITSIVQHSTNEQFRQACFTLLNVTNSKDLRRCVTRKLWHMGAEKYGVVRPVQSVRRSASLTALDTHREQHHKSTRMNRDGEQHNSQTSFNRHTRKHKRARLQTGTSQSNVHPMSESQLDAAQASEYDGSVNEMRTPGRTAPKSCSITRPPCTLKESMGAPDQNNNSTPYNSNSFTHNNAMQFSNMPYNSEGPYSVTCYNNVTPYYIPTVSHNRQSTQHGSIFPGSLTSQTHTCDSSTISDTIWSQREHVSIETEDRGATPSIPNEATDCDDDSKCSSEGGTQLQYSSEGGAGAQQGIHDVLLSTSARHMEDSMPTQDSFDLLAESSVVSDMKNTIEYDGTSFSMTSLASSDTQEPIALEPFTLDDDWFNQVLLDQSQSQ
ncbi:unnamed protein product [Owenia fusiformis]|uniref:Uncharacterized protein n=2 Tax=Owenia fusiformis TaxID=6347 RepID=A0A8S4PI50_OWEFU|nr:unnamed protein product [Owenia fusiformis]